MIRHLKHRHDIEELFEQLKQHADKSGKGKLEDALGMGHKGKPSLGKEVGAKHKPATSKVDAAWARAHELGPKKNDLAKAGPEFEKLLGCHADKADLALTHAEKDKVGGLAGKVSQASSKAQLQSHLEQVLRKAGKLR